MTSLIKRDIYVDMTKNYIFDDLLNNLEIDILSGKFHPRERLVESDLMQRYGVTRAAIRKVLKELEIKHLVRSVPNRGVMVSAPDKAEMKDIFQTRLVLESFAIENISLPASTEIIQEIEQHMQAYESALSEASFSEHHYANRQFHHKILLLSGNKIIAEIIDDLKYRAHFWQHMIGRQKRFEQTLTDHRAMFEVLVDGNLAELKRLNIFHLTQGYENFLTDLL